MIRSDRGKNERTKLHVSGLMKWVDRLNAVQRGGRKTEMGSEMYHKTQINKNNFIAHTTPKLIKFFSVIVEFHSGNSYNMDAQGPWKTENSLCLQMGQY